jgi:hypothetical protein
MSGEQRGAFSPTEKPGKLTVAEFQQFAGFMKDLLADQPVIKYSIYAAGMAGLFDSIHWAWVFIAFLVRFVK